MLRRTLFVVVFVLTFAGLTFAQSSPLDNFATITGEPQLPKDYDKWTVGWRSSCAAPDGRALETRYYQAPSIMIRDIPVPPEVVMESFVDGVRIFVMHWTIPKKGSATGTRLYVLTKSGWMMQYYALVKDNKSRLLQDQNSGFNIYGLSNEDFDRCAK